MINKKTIDSAIYSAIFSKNSKEKTRLNIRQTAQKQGIYLASIHELYRAIGRGEVSGFSVPAFNIRTLTYDKARLIFQLAKEHKTSAFIFEIAKSEQGYTDQKPDEYAVSILAAAIKEGYRGPIFLQGDHYQLSGRKYKEDPDTEISNLKKLIKESIDAGFYNIDIDSSTLVDLEKPTLDEQQKNNYKTTALLTEYIREIQPKNVMVSIGGEIGHIGGKNSTVDEFEAFMKGYLKALMATSAKALAAEGISKVAIQTGTSHGGVMLADGTIQKVSIDFEALKSIGDVARKKYGLGGPVQHGASTLPDELFDEFVKCRALEVHLATGFQNIVYEKMPEDLRRKMYEWLKENCKKEWKEGQSEEQFIYKTRKKALGPFKKDLWSMSEKEKEPIIRDLKRQFDLLFRKLNIINTRVTLERYIK